jgi:hypothetical protein
MVTLGLSQHEACAIRGKPREEWPTSFRIAWDFSPAHIYFAEDGASPDDYSSSEYCFGEADLIELDSLFHGHSRRSVSELWTIAAHKVAGVIWHWSNGGVMTPPLLDINMGCLVITGGNNRIAVCRADGQLRLPFIYLKDKAELFSTKIKSFQSLPQDINTYGM